MRYIRTTRRKSRNEIIMAAAEKGNTLEKYCFRCFSCYQQQVHIDATDATAINIVLKNIGNALIGAGSKVKICRRCFRRQRVLHHFENNRAVCADATHGSSKKPRRKLRKRSFEGQSASRKCDLDRNSADGEKSDSDGCEKFTDFLQYDSDDLSLCSKQF